MRRSFIAGTFPFAGSLSAHRDYSTPAIGAAWRCLPRPEGWSLSCGSTPPPPAHEGASNDLGCDYDDSRCIFRACATTCQARPIFQRRNSPPIGG